MSRGSKNRRNEQRRARRRQQAHREAERPRYGLAFTEKGRDTLAETYGQFRDRPLYYLLDEHGQPMPVGKNYLLTAEERARWRAHFDDSAARTLAETVIPNPEAPAYPVVVHTAFEAMDTSYAFPLPSGEPVLWRTVLLDKTMEEMRVAAEAEEDDGGAWLVEKPPEDPPGLSELAAKLDLEVEALGEWYRVYSTREAALEGHDETVRWMRRALGVF